MIIRIAPSTMMKRVFALLGKDILLEFRQKHTFYGILLYIASTIFVLYLSLDKTDAAVWNGLFWVIQLFICVNAVAKSFLQESRGRMLYFYSIASPVEFILAKLLYNLLLMVLMSLISLALFATFLDNPVSNMLLFTGIVVLGGMGISIVFTLMSAIAAKAQQNAALIAILGFPVILPQLMLLMRLSKTAFAEVFKEGALLQMTGLIAGLDVLVIGLALILFPYLWKE
ncbi:MAG TPA: heme exporter protein CcmB [Ferruginibacter sp.]|nr:heme exporter protein CcmB [Ferruginibacter sp.]HNA00386.1 heme exporter protein CcmB [Ferruginibacter sp.]HNA15629.1 heme exporter protein CcmB [Ferruginibacter sp.]HNH20755.1 heme exporter protein CcmB [Ferruginibacter sp.]HNJ95128.1 heme exporter protein CcmB [Ferruginibacter sp.]